MCGGPTEEEKRRNEAQKASFGAAGTTDAAAAEREKLQLGHLKGRVEGGLPYDQQYLDFAGGALARSAAPGRAALERRHSGYGDSLYSGAKEADRLDFESDQRRSFDDMILRYKIADEAAKDRAAGMLNPLGYSGQAQQGYQSVMGFQPNAPSATRQFLGGLAQQGTEIGLEALMGLI